MRSKKLQEIRRKLFRLKKESQNKKGPGSGISEANLRTGFTDNLFKVLKRGVPKGI
jgi:hypothetical protein